MIYRKEPDAKTPQELMAFFDKFGFERGHLEACGGHYWQQVVGYGRHQKLATRVYFNFKTLQDIGITPQYDNAGRLIGATTMLGETIEPMLALCLLKALDKIKVYYDLAKKKWEYKQADAMLKEFIQGEMARRVFAMAQTYAQEYTMNKHGVISLGGELVGIFDKENMHLYVDGYMKPFTCHKRSKALNMLAEKIAIKKGAQLCA